MSFIYKKRIKSWAPLLAVDVYPARFTITVVPGLLDPGGLAVHAVIGQEKRRLKKNIFNRLRKIFKKDKLDGPGILIFKCLERPQTPSLTPIY